MIVIDVNLLLYAHMKSSSFYRPARAWFEKTLSSGQEVGIPLQSAMAFLRITTNQNIPLGRLEISAALSIVDGWLGQPNVELLYPTEAHWPIFRRMLLEGRAAGVLGTDAHLAALTLECGGTLCSTDSDFARFPGLRWQNPLAKA
jgi:toxin-antitoxin system PIN domain toxin